METTQAAQTILAIDGCPLHCARNTLEQAGFTKFEHLCLSDLGMEKGKTPVTEEPIAKVVKHKARAGWLAEVSTMTSREERNKTWT